MPKYKAYIAAIDHYPNPANNLPSCINDANAFRQRIDDVYKFTDVRYDYDEKATLQNVEAGLSWLFGGASADDRLVFFFSGHGFQVAEGQNLEEVLCLYDQFLFDNVISRKSQGVPPGVFTLISDSCHSGGMYKVMMTEGHVDVAQTKVLKVPPIADNDKVFLDPSRVPQLRYRPFGARLGSASTIGKRFGITEGKEFDEAGQLQMNGMLLSACLADETASASTPKTGGKSAFTYALLEQLAAFGPNVSNRQLVEGSTRMLRDLGFRQTPVLVEPTSPNGLAATSFLLFQGQAAPPVSSDWMTRIIQDVLSSQRKDFAMMHDKSFNQPGSGGDEKFWGVLASLASVAVPAIMDALRKGDYQPQKDFTAVPGGEEKFWRTLLNVVTTAVPAVVQALRKSGYEPQKDFSGSQEKFLGSILRVATGCLPPLLRTIAAQGIQPQKDFGGEEKFWGAIASAISATLPVVINALSKQGAPAKGFEDVPAGDQKFFGAIASVIGTLGPLVIQALSKSGLDPQKDFQQAGQEKFLGALMSVIGTVAPVVIQALSKSGAEPQKDFGGEEKFWGAFASIVQAALPAVIGALRKGDFQSDKGFAPTSGDGSGDDKFWGAIARVVASAIPTIVGELTKGGTEPSTISPALAPSLAPSGMAMPRDLIANVVSSALPQLQRTN
ncbi:MAG: caspase family protein [Bradyrhizobium sp.]|nr:caspase family protein [Bradyrhizobium sp.]